MGRVGGVIHGTVVALAMLALAAGDAFAAAPAVSATAGPPPKNVLSVNAGGAMMFNTKNGLHPPASDVGVAWTRPGVWGGFQVGMNHVAFFTGYETAHVLDLRGGGTRVLPHSQ